MTMPDVLFVGAGPGDPGLLTVRALSALETADIALYDALVSREVPHASGVTDIRGPADGQSRR